MHGIPKRIRIDWQVKKIMTKSFSEEEVILHVSDIHAGEIINLPTNKYNLDIMDARMDYYFYKVTRLIVDMYGKVMPIKKIHLIMTGDMIHNETMRGSAKMSAEGAFTEQIEAVSETIANGIVYMLDSIKGLNEFNVYGVMGNHGRVGKPGEEAPEANFDRQVYDRVKLLVTMKNRRRKVKLTWNFPTSSYLTTRIASHTVVAEHWSQVKSYSGTPYYGLARLRDLRFKLEKGDMAIYLGGHFHKEFAENDGVVETIMCPSLAGQNEYSLGLGMGGMVGQNFYMVSAKHGITVKRTIRMEHIQ